MLVMAQDLLTKNPVHFPGLRERVVTPPGLVTGCVARKSIQGGWAATPADRTFPREAHGGANAELI